MKLPDLVTPRLRLQPFQPGDVDALHRLWTDPDVRRWLWDDLVIPREQAQEVVEAMIASERAHGVGMWCVHPAEGGELIGFCGFRHVGELAEIELLYGLYPAHWGRGLATEASRAAIDWLFATLAPPRILAGADPPNTASFGVMERLGMRRLPEGLPAVPGAEYWELES